VEVAAAVDGYQSKAAAADVRADACPDVVAFELVAVVHIDHRRQRYHRSHVADHSQVVVAVVPTSRHVAVDCDARCLMILAAVGRDDANRAAVDHTDHHSSSDRQYHSRAVQ
jgi:hypothetical protein